MPGIEEYPSLSPAERKGKLSKSALHARPVEVEAANYMVAEFLQDLSDVFSVMLRIAQLGCDTVLGIADHQRDTLAAQR